MGTILFVKAFCHFKWMSTGKTIKKIINKEPYFSPHQSLKRKYNIFFLAAFYMPHPLTKGWVAIFLQLKHQHS